MLFVIWNMYLASSNWVQQATRVESTRLLLILITEYKKIWQSGALIVGLVTRQVNRADVNKHNTFRIRCSKHYNKYKFIQKIDDWSDSFSWDYAWGKIVIIVLSMPDKLAPYKEVRVKKGRNSWINKKDKYIWTFRRPTSQSIIKLQIVCQS